MELAFSLLLNNEQANSYDFLTEKEKAEFSRPCLGSVSYYALPREKGEIRHVIILRNRRGFIGEIFDLEQRVFATFRSEGR